MEEITEEEFERLGRPNKEQQDKILENVSDKIKKYDRQKKGWRYNSAYHMILNARGREPSLVDEAGMVQEKFLQVIEDALGSFEMSAWGRMGDNFQQRLKKKLTKSELQLILKKFRNMRIDSPDLEKFKIDVQQLYEALSTVDKDGLSARHDRFDVGATKIMNFLFPELFVMVDRYVKKALRRSGELSFEKYWSIMMTCRKELEEWKESHGTTDSLLELDTKPTTLTRIFDKCAFIMGKCNGC